jgi:hypothetical protein
MSLDGVYQKIAWAEEHLNRLHTHPVYNNFEPTRGAVKINLNGPWHVVTVDRMPPTPPEVSLICGDYIQNLRSALDHLVWQLVIDNGNIPDNRNAFPIFQDESDFTERVVKPHSKDAGPLRGLDPAGVPWAIIRDEQPYQRPKQGPGDAQADRLSILAELSNIDKHRILYVAHYFVTEADARTIIGWAAKAVLEESVFSQVPLSLVNETEILRFRFTDPANADVHVKGPLPVDPAFGSDKIQAPLWLVRSLLEKVRVLVRAFE